MILVKLPEKYAIRIAEKLDELGLTAAELAIELQIGDSLDNMLNQKAVPYPHYDTILTWLERPTDAQAAMLEIILHIKDKDLRNILLQEFYVGNYDVVQKMMPSKSYEEAYAIRKAEHNTTLQKFSSLLGAAISDIKL